MITRYGRAGPVHRVVEHGSLLYLGGIVADDASLSMGEQTRQILHKLERTLIEHGSDRSSVIQAQVFITDMRLKPEMNPEWQAFFGDDLPARVTLAFPRSRKAS